MIRRESYAAEYVMTVARAIATAEQARSAYRNAIDKIGAIDQFEEGETDRIRQVNSIYSSPLPSDLSAWTFARHQPSLVRALLGLGIAQRDRRGQCIYLSDIFGHHRLHRDTVHVPGKHGQQRSDAVESSIRF